MARKVNKKVAKKRARKTAPVRTPILLDESLESLLNSPDPKTRKAAAILKANRERWFDVMTSRIGLQKFEEGKPRGKVKRFVDPEQLKKEYAKRYAEAFTKPEPRQFYTEARAFADGNALVQFLANRPFIARILGYEGFTVGKSKKVKRPSRAEMKTIRDLDFVKELSPSDRKEFEKQITRAFKAANSGGIIFQVEVDYDRPARTPVDTSETDPWETAKKRDAKGGATKARKQRKKTSKK